MWERSKSRINKNKQIKKIECKKKNDGLLKKKNDGVFCHLILKIKRGVL